MSVVSNFSDLTAESTDEVPSVEEETLAEDDGAVSAVDHYNPKDLVKSWTKVAPYRGTENRNGNSSVVPSSHSQPTKTYASRRVIYSIAVLLILVIVAMIMAIVIVLAGNSNGNSPAGANSSSPPPPPLVFPPSPPPSPTLPSTSFPPTSTVETDLRNLLESVSPDSGLALADSRSPQYEAFSWLVLDPRLTEYSDRRKIQRYVLAALYFSTGGDKWEDNEGWLSGDHECEWQLGGDYDYPCGTTNDYIVALGLAENTLNGTIPPELVLLSDSLVHLEVQRNFVSAVPSELSLLTKLRLLDLSENYVAGPIPSFNAMQDLTSLILQKNELTGPIPELGLPLSLTILQLGENNLSEIIPSTIGLLSTLEVLDLSTNKLHGLIPTEIGLLTALKTLNLHENNLNDEIPANVPVEICQLGIPDITVDCEMVFCTCCGDTCLQSHLSASSADSGAALSTEGSPQQLAFSWIMSDQNLKSYQRYRILQRYALATLFYSVAGYEWEDENLNMDPTEHECTWGFPATSVLSIASAEASSSESDYLSPSMAIDGNLSTRWASERRDGQWIRIDLREPHVLESVQLNWEDAFASEYRVELSNNKYLWRSIFTESDGNGGKDIVQLNGANARYIQIYGEKRGSNYGFSLWEIKVRGTLPATDPCDSDQNLVQIAFDGKNLSGSLPAELALLSNTLEVLSLPRNVIWGSIPSEIGLLTKLTALDLSSNIFTGTLPSELGSLSNLEFLLLRENELSGTVPRELGGTARLAKLHIDQNLLTGNIPDDVCDLGMEELRIDCEEVQCSCCGDWCQSA